MDLSFRMKPAGRYSPAFNDCLNLILFINLKASDLFLQ